MQWSQYSTNLASLMKLGQTMQDHLETHLDHWGNLGIRINHSSPRNSESNGMAERACGLLKESLNENSGIKGGGL